MRDLDTSTATLAAAAGVKGGGAALPTAAGLEVGAAIASARDTLGLSKVLGCNTHGVYEQGESLDQLYVNKVVPQALFRPAGNASQWFTQCDGGLRYDLYGGNVTMDAVYHILPFRDELLVVRRQSGAVLRRLLAELNREGRGGAARAAYAGRAGSSRGGGGGRGDGRGDDVKGGCYASTDVAPAAGRVFDAFFVHFDAPDVAQALADITGAPAVVEPAGRVLGPGAPASNTDMMARWVGSPAGFGPGPCPPAADAPL
jgi:hypothetical protein